jgi:putative tryptophan/tyrosine transport system substrate-binding protein
MGHQSRRQFLQSSLALAGLSLMSGCGVPFGPSAQRGELYRVGCLESSTPPSAGGAPTLEAFRQGLREHGYIEGQQVILEVRYSEGRDERRSELAAELVHLPVDVIMTGGGASGAPVRAAQQATSTIPIVFVNVVDPVASGLVASLARPGGNVTGLTQSAGQENAKRLQLLKEVVPGLSRVAVWGQQSLQSTFRETEVAAQALGLEVLSLVLSGPDGLGAVQTATITGRADGLLGLPGPLLPQLRPQILDFTAQHRLPAMYAQNSWARDGGLMNYGPSQAENYRRAAYYVDRILKGAKPADLPVEQPSRFEFSINLQTAQALGLTIPQSILQQATELIQ